MAIASPSKSLSQERPQNQLPEPVVIEISGEKRDPRGNHIQRGISQ
jgi:hypothetical protein